MVEQLTLNQRVHGSSPCAPTKSSKFSADRRCHSDKSPSAHSDTKSPAFILWSRIFAATARCLVVRFALQPRGTGKYELRA